MKKRERLKKSRKERKAREKSEYEAQRARENEDWLQKVPTEAEMANARNRFRALSHRGFKFGFEPSNVTVQASSPKEFNEKLEAELARITKELPEY